MVTAASHRGARDPAGRRAPGRRAADAPPRDARASARHPAPRGRGQQDGPRRLPRGRLRARSSRTSARSRARTGIDDAIALRAAVRARRRHGRRARRRTSTGTTARRCCRSWRPRRCARARAHARRSAFRCSAWRGPTATARRGYLGRVEAGSIAVGDAVTVLPSGRTTQVARDPHAATRAAAAARATARRRRRSTLDDEIDVSRGDMLVRGTTRRRRRARSTRRCAGSTSAPLDRAPHLPAAPHDARRARARSTRIDHLWNVSTQQAGAGAATRSR